jgi:hypothetical protein
MMVIVVIVVIVVDRVEPARVKPPEALWGLLTQKPHALRNRCS